MYKSQTIRHPGWVIKQLLLSEGNLTQEKLANALRVSRRTINELVGGKRGLSPDMACRLEKVTKIPAEMWQSLQGGYDVYLAKQKLAEDPLISDLESLSFADDLLRWHFMKAGQRDQEKESARQADMNRIESGEMSPMEVNRSNAFINPEQVEVNLPAFVNSSF